jgi:hypothetical protein
MRRSVAQLSKQLGQTFESSCGAGEEFPTPRPLDAWAISFTRDRPRPPASGPAGVEADDPGASARVPAGSVHTRPLSIVPILQHQKLINGKRAKIHQFLCEPPVCLAPGRSGSARHRKALQQVWGSYRTEVADIVPWHTEGNELTCCDLRQLVALHIEFGNWPKRQLVDIEDVVTKLFKLTEHFSDWYCEMPLLDLDKN